MARLMKLIAIFAAAVGFASDASPGPTVVTGATGRTGSMIYKLMQSKGYFVRALVRNVTKARDVLGCSKCDEAEGIFLGDISDASSLQAVMTGASALMVATSATPIVKVDNGTYRISFPKNGEPIDVDWHGGKNQLKAFAERTAGTSPGQIALISTMGTETPETPQEQYFKDYIGFYKLNFEAELMSSGLPFTIVKAGGLDYSGTEPGKKELVVGHDGDNKPTPSTVARADVARVMVAAIEQPQLSENLRFDLCGKDGTPTADADLGQVLQRARYPWSANTFNV